jgi:hypothetical protein
VQFRNMLPIALNAVGPRGSLARPPSGTAKSRHRQWLLKSRTAKAASFPVTFKQAPLRGGADTLVNRAL